MTVALFMPKGKTQWELWQEQAERGPPRVSFHGLITAPWPVHRDSVKRNKVKFTPLSRQDVHQWFYKAKTWQAVGRAHLAVLHSLIFDFLDYRTGRLDPSWSGIGAKARYKRTAVYEALKGLRAMGIIDWLRTCSDSKGKDGKFQLVQETNVYVILPPSQWRGYKDQAPAAPAPAPETWGACPPLPASTEAFIAARDKAGEAERLALLEMDPSDHLAMALARLLRARVDRQPPD